MLSLKNRELLFISNSNTDSVSLRLKILLLPLLRFAYMWTPLKIEIYTGTPSKWTISADKKCNNVE